MKKNLANICFVLISFTMLGVTFFLGHQDLAAPEAVSVMSVAGNSYTSLTPVIDPGHGGTDGGSVSPGGVIESGINLTICLKMEQIFAFLGTVPVMTRDSEKIDYPDSANSAKEQKTYDQKRRVEIINSVKNAVLISIHQNEYSTSSPFGAQVLYAVTPGSKEFSEYLQNSLVVTLNPSNHRLITQIPSHIYIMKHITCPAVLIECGFLSNPSEEILLQDDVYQTKIAATVVSGYFMTYNVLLETYSGGTNEI